MWISVNERLPDLIGMNLCYGNGMIYFAFFSSAEIWCIENQYLENITHWMPLPKPPED